MIEIIKSFLNGLTMKQILGCVLIIMIIFLLLQLLYIFTGHPRRIFHDVFGQHMPIDDMEKRGINTCSKCKYCGKEIMQDSQGNWF